MVEKDHNHELLEFYPLMLMLLGTGHKESLLDYHWILD